MDSKGDGRHFWNVLFSGRLGPVSMVVCCSAGGWFGRCRGQWFGRFLGQVQLFFMDSKGLCWHYGGWFGRFPGQWFGRFPGQLHLFFMDSKGDGRHFWNVLFSGRLGPVSMVVCCSAGGWFGRCRGQWFGRFLRQLQLFFMDSKGDGKHSVLALRRLVWTLSWPVVWTLSFFMDSKGDGRHFWNVLFSGRLGPVYMVVCCSAGGWFGRFRGQWFGRFLRQLQLVFMDSKGDGKHSVLALRRLVWTLSWPVVWTLSFFMDSKGDGRHFWNVLFSGRLDPVYKVVCCSLRVFCLAWARILLVFRSFRIWRLDAFLASGLDAFLASYTCFLWIPKVTGGIFETFCFPVVLALCLWWFAVAQAAGLDAVVASGLDAFFASYNCFL